MGCLKVNTVINTTDDNMSTTNVLKTIIKSGVEEGFSVCDITALIEQHLNFKTALPKVEPFFAIKCNPDKIILSILAALGANFDCASLGEIQLVLSLDIDPKRIIYANPIKPLSHLRFANEKNVTMMTFDHECELSKIKSTNPKAELLLRIKADANRAFVIFGEKFGCDADLEAPRILQVAFDMGMNVVGICFNVGTNCQEPEAFYRGIAKARALFDIAKNIGFQMTILDIGGGFPCISKMPIDTTAASINSAIDRFFPTKQFKNLRIIAEPGRYYVSPVLTVASQIHTIKSKVDKLNNQTFSYFITDGIYGNFLMLGLFDEKVFPYVIKDTKGKVYLSTIFGPTCDSADKIVSNYLLPKLEVNDWVICSNMGAYTTATKTNFNGFTTPQCIYICSQSIAKQLRTIDSLKTIFDGSRNL